MQKYQPQAITAATVAALLCMLAQPGQARQLTPEGQVRGGDGRPFVGVTLRFTDHNGNAVTLTTDAQGLFRHPELDTLSHDPHDGFVQTLRSFSTGGPTRYFFAPLGVREAIFRETSGHLLPGLPVQFVRERQTLSRVTDQKGKATVSGVPIVPSRAIGGEYLLSTVRVSDPRYVIADVREQATSRSIRYLVSVARSGSITGRLAAPGQKVGGWYAFATGKRASGEILYHSAVVNAAGRFRIVSLLPGRYFVGARPAHGGRSKTAAHPVRVQSGGTATVELQTRP